MSMKRPAIGLFLLLLASPANADLTAEEVLADQLNLLSGYGLIEMTTTGTTAHSGGLDIDGFLGTHTSDDGDEVQIRIGGVELIEQRDGSVRVVYPERLQVTVVSTEDGEPKEAGMTIVLEDMSHVVSGSAQDIQHDISFDKASLADFIMIPPAEELDNFDFTFAVIDVDTTLNFVDGDVQKRSFQFDVGAFRMAVATILPDGIDRLRAALPNDQTSEFESVDMAIDLKNAAGAFGYVDGEVPQHTLDVRFDLFDWQQSMQAEGIDGMEFNMAAEDFALNYDIALSIEAMERSFADALKQGQQASGALSYTSMSYDLDVKAPEGPVRMLSSNGRTQGQFGLDSSGIRFTSSSADTVAEFSGPMDEDFPLGQIGYKIRSGVFDMVMPILPSDGTQPFALKLSIEGLETAEDLWALLDPKQRLPRDPVDLVIDLEGQAVVTSDVFADDTQLPFQDFEITLNTLRFAIAGAVLTGNGSVTDTSTPGKPSGVGTLNTQLTGANTLLDTLVDMGLLPSEQAMAARMALGVIARAGDGPDTLVSTIEVQEDGAILANGQRIK